MENQNKSKTERAAGEGKTPERQCTAAELFQALSGKWVLPVFYQIQLEDGPRRFGELRKATGAITTSELTKTLRHLELLALVHREQFREVPLRVEYRLTPLGESLREPIAALAAWLDAHRQEVIAVLIAGGSGKADKVG